MVYLQKHLESTSLDFQSQVWLILTKDIAWTKEDNVYASDSYQLLDEFNRRGEKDFLRSTRSDGRYYVQLISHPIYEYSKL